VTAAPASPRRPRLRLEGITRPAWILSLVSFFTDLSSEMVYPIIPLFLTVTLGAPAVAVGIVEGVAEATANGTRLVAGRWADRAGSRKPFVVAGYGLAVVGKFVIAIAPVWPFALVGRATDRFGKGIRSAPRDALLADFTEAKYRGRVFGFHRAMDSLGAVGGPLIGLALLWAFPGRLRDIIFMALVPGVVAVFVLRWLPEHRKESVSSEDEDGRPQGKLPGRFYVLLAITTLFMAGNSSDAFLILRSKDLGLATTAVILAYVVYNAVYASASLPAGIISDRIPRAWVLTVGYAVFAAVYTGFALTSSSWAVWPLFAVYGFYIALTDGVSKALVADMAPKELRSTAQGLYSGVAGIAALGASVAAGVLWDTVSPRAPFVLGATCGVLAAILLAVVTLVRPGGRPVAAG
jgi:MFS family permease